MDDILSGGVIDSSTSGPIPPSRDDRDRDILLSQKEKQDQDAIGGTQFPPKPQPLPPIPEAIEIAPPLPPIPSFDLNYSGPAFEETREIARQTIVDVLKNVTINGQGPTVEGSSIAFNISQQPPQNELLFFGGVISRPTLQEPQFGIAPEIINIPIQGPSVSQPQNLAPSIIGETAANQEIPVFVTPPQRTLSQQADLEQAINPENQPQPKRSVTSEDFGSGGISGFTPTYKELSEYPTFKQPEIKEPPQESRIKAEDFGTMGEKQEARYESLSSYDSKNVYRVTEEEKAERLKKNEQEEGFDRESSIRQRGETQQEFKERQEKLAEERQQKREDQKILEKIRTEGFSETSILPSGMVPVALTRADGQKKILAYLSSEFVGVTEGGEGDERITTLPPEESYYVGGGGTTDSHPFQISTSTDEEGTITLTVNVGTLNSLLPSNVFNGPALRKFPVGSGLKYVILTGASDGKQFTSCSLSVENQAVQPQTPTVFGLPTTAAFLLGVVYNGKVFQVQNTNILVTGKQQYVKQKTAPAPAGTLPYEIYYVWG